MNYIIYDIEATCWQNDPPHLIQETIEIGAYLLDDYGDILEKFSRFIRPVKHPNLSPYCVELTGITQLMVNRAKTFPEVIEEFQDWINLDDEFVLCAWGDFDKKQLKRDCEAHRLDTWWLDEFLNMKTQYEQFKRLTKRTSMVSALKREGYEYVGRQHRAIDDAFNLTKIFNCYLGEWSW